MSACDRQTIETLKDNLYVGLRPTNYRNPKGYLNVGLRPTNYRNPKGYLNVGLRPTNYRKEDFE